MLSRPFRSACAAVGASARRIVASEVSFAAARGSVAWASSVGAVIDANVAERPHREVYKAVDQDLAFDCKQVQKYVNGLAAGLVQSGYTKGSKLALWMANETEHWVALLAASRIGVVVISIDPAVPATGVEEILKAEGARGLLFTERYNGAVRSSELAAVIPELTATVYGDVFKSKKLRAFRHAITTNFDYIEGFGKYRDLPAYTEGFPEVKAADAAIRDEDVAVVQYTTSGSGSGYQKAKTFTQKQLIDEAKKAAAAAKLTSDDVVIVTAPLNTGTGFLSGVLASVVAGAKFVVPGKEFDAEATAKAAKDLRATTIAGTPDQTAAVAAALGGAKLKAAPVLA